MKLSLIGLGLLGNALALRWLAAGWQVSGYDIDPSRRAAFREAGGHAVDELWDLFPGDGPLALCLPNSQTVAEVVGRCRGQLQPGQVIIDLTTGRPEDTERLASELSVEGVRWVDATVAGSSQQVAEDEAVLLVGGDVERDSEVDRCLAALARRRYYLGAVGAGARMKLVVNLAIGLHRAVLAEAFCLAEQLGLDAAQTLDVLRACPSYSRAMDTKGDKMVRRDFAPQARLAQHAKDVQLMLAVANQQQRPLHLSECHARLLQELIDQGQGSLDNSAIMLAYAAARQAE